MRIEGRVVTMMKTIIEKYKLNHLRNLIVNASLKGLSAAVLMILVYQFYSVEFIRASIEDSAFDTTSWFALSKEDTDTETSNVFILLVDDKYLRSKNLLDENNGTNYGYIMPREYLVEIINSVDALVADIDEENYPRALFLDYDLAYLSDPHNKIASEDDLELLETLKKDRPYTIYLPMTANYNIVYYSKNTEIQKQIQNQKIKFVSVGLTTASDGVSRRYYAYETYKDFNGSDKKFMNIAIELWAEQHSLESNIFDSFAQKGRALIENRIIFKDKHITEDNNYTTWQSNWKQLSAISAHYPLDMIYEDDLRNSVIMIGSAHNASDDSFEIDAFSQEISGIEMHANALMTLSYLKGHLKRLPLFWSIIIVFSIVFSIDLLLSLIFGTKAYQKFIEWNEKVKTEWIQNVIFTFLPKKREDFSEMWLILLSIVLMFFISYKLLLGSDHYWFNWLIPAMMSVPYIMIMGIKKLFIR